MVKSVRRPGPDRFDRIQRVLEDRGISRAELATKIGVNKSQVSRAFSLRGDFFKTKMHDIAEALGVTYEWIVNGGDSPPAYGSVAPISAAKVAEGVRVVTLVPYQRGHRGPVLIDPDQGVFGVTFLN